MYSSRSTAHSTRRHSEQPVAECCFAVSRLDSAMRCIDWALANLTLTALLSFDFRLLVRVRFLCLVCITINIPRCCRYQLLVVLCTDVLDLYQTFMAGHGLTGLNPHRTTVPFQGQTTSYLTGLLPNGTAVRKPSTHRLSFSSKRLFRSEKTRCTYPSAQKSY